MAYLKSTNIDGDLSVTGGITVSDTGLIRESSGSDFYLGIGTVLPSGTDLNSIVEPGIYVLHHNYMTSYVNCPFSREDSCRMEVKYIWNVGTTSQTIHSPDGLYYRYAWNGANVFQPWELLKGIDDTGWQYVTLNSVVVPYDNNQGYMPRYRKIGNLVQVKGTLSPSSSTNSFGSSGGAVVFTLPEGYRPSVIPITSVFQGTSTSSFAMSINTAGVATISRYRDENGYETPITTSWMPFHFEYFADQ